MHIGFRYHVASLVGISLSLILGILIGGALFQDDRLVEEQGYVIKELENQFSSLQQDLEDLISREKAIVDGWNQMKASLVEERLAGQTVWLMSENSTSNFKWTKELFTKAGATLHEIFIPELTLTENDMLADQVIVWIDENGLSPSSVAVLKQIVENGAHVTVLKTSAQTNEFMLEPSMEITQADTLLGEIALVFGIATGEERP